jgi:hypothetical protein
MTPAPRREWPATLELAQYTAAQGRFEAADSILASFAARYPGTAETLETAYWRALFKLDPLDRTESLAPAMSLLDGYVADTRPREHLVEAVSLRRLATQIEALATRTAPTVATAQRDTREPPPTTRPSAEQRPAAEPSAADAAEIKRLKDELAKANAELERIRRRLMRPPPKG